ncbi:MAG: hypothetical protein GY806_14985 [Gammaproteobacteria bacterium]|nr:hypothetical protein [Gammaproteobacteria bacterium]
MKNTLIVTCLIFLAGCTPIKVLAPPVDELFIAEANLTEEETNQHRQGREIYLNFCTECHRARQVDNITSAKWKKHVPKMLKKAELYPEEIIPLKAYLKTAGRINQQLIEKRAE